MPLFVENERKKRKKKSNKAFREKKKIYVAIRSDTLPYIAT